MAIDTNKKYILQKLSKFNVSESDVDVMLLDAGLEGDDNVDPISCKKTIYASLSSILPTANISEGGYSISWNMEALKLWYSSLCNEIGMPNALKPKIRNRSNIW